MTPTVIKSETRIFGLVHTDWYCIRSLQDRPKKSKVSRQKGQTLIKEYGLRLVHKDYFGEVYAGEEGCFARYFALKDICKNLTKAQAEVFIEEQKQIHNFLEHW